MAAAGRLHSKDRDASAISHHYDVSNRFYEWVLGPSMAYTCACYPREDASLEEAQAYKFDLVARKIGLREGMRLLDVGCGWGGMVMHAAREYGVKALGVTLSAQQASWAQQAIAEAGLSGLAEVRHLDYRDVPETGFDAVSSIGLTEHIGKDNLPGYFAFLYGKLKPGGRLLNHCITRPDGAEPTRRRGGFINRYVFPDGELEGPGYLISRMHDTGFEVRHEENLREHYAKTLAAWCANLDAHYDEAVADVGPGTARVWRLYMAGSRLGFERNQIQLHQVLCVRLARRRRLRHAAAPRLGAAAGPGRRVAAGRPRVRLPARRVSGTMGRWTLRSAGPREIVILGSTGSIGTQAADVIRRNPDRFRVGRAGRGRREPRSARGSGGRVRRRRRGGRGRERRGVAVGAAAARGGGRPGGRRITRTGCPSCSRARTR